MTTLDFDVLASKLAGVAGALVSMRFLKGSWPERIATAAGGAALSYFVAPYLAQKTGLPEGLSGFLLGLFGMAVVSRVWEWVQTTPLAPLWDIFVAWLKKLAGV